MVNLCQLIKVSRFSMSYIFLFIIFTASSTVILHIVGLGLPKMLMVFLSSTYAIVFFNLLNQEQIKSTYINLWHNKRLFLILSISSCGVTFGGFLVPIYYLPSIHLVSYMSIMSTIGALMIYLYKKNP